jgi:hypothetical protein
MNELEIFDKTKKALMYSSFDKDGLPLPFAKEIFLIECYVAGTNFHNVKEIEPELNIGDFLIFKREPENPYDEYAIAIYTELQKKIGYVPKDNNEILARLMDSGKMIFGKIVSKKWIDNWLKIEIKIFMREI